MYNIRDYQWVRKSTSKAFTYFRSAKLKFTRPILFYGEWEGGPVNQVNHTSWVAVVTPTDRPKSVRNCCLIELFCGVVLSLCPFDISVGVGAFVIGLGQISSFLSLENLVTNSFRNIFVKWKYTFTSISGYL